MLTFFLISGSVLIENSADVSPPDPRSVLPPVGRCRVLVSPAPSTDTAAAAAARAAAGPLRLPLGCARLGSQTGDSAAGGSRRDRVVVGAGMAVRPASAVTSWPGGADMAE